MSDLRITAYQKDFDHYKQLLDKNHNLALVGISKMGVRSIVQFFCKEIQNQYDYIIIDNGLVNNFLELATRIPSNTTKVLIAIPNYSDQKVYFKTQLQQYLLNKYNFKIDTIVGIDIHDYLNPEKEFKFSTKLINSIEIVQPRNQEETQLLIKDHSKAIPKKIYKTIYNLSGGIPGLIKRCCNVYASHNKLTNELILQDPATSVNLHSIQQDFNVLNETQRNDFGLTDKQGNILSHLLRHVYSNDHESLVITLTNFFKKREGILITHDVIDDLIGKKDSFSLWNKYKLIERVKKTLDNKFQLKNIHGKGYLLKKWLKN